MIDELKKFEELEEHIKNSGLKYGEAILDYYKNLGERLGFTVRENSSVIKNGVNSGRLDVIWLEPNIAFVVEFGRFEDILKHLWKIVEFSPSLAVLLLSSKSECRAEKVSELVEKSGITREIRDRFLIIDVTEKKVVREPQDVLSRPS